MRVLVCGGRNYFDRQTIYRTLTALHHEKPITALIHGDAQGADTLASEWATTLGVPSLAYTADWKKHGKAAGPLRNAFMLEDGRPDLVVAFPGGTADMIEKATKAGVPVNRILGGKA